MTLLAVKNRTTDVDEEAIENEPSAQVVPETVRPMSLRLTW